MAQMLQIQSPVIFDESISQYEIHVHHPYNSSTFNNNDEIRIAIQQQDACLLPSKSSVRVYGQLTKADGNATALTNLVNNGICHLFREIRYEMNGVEIDRNKNVGITSLMKSLVSFSPSQVHLLENANWIGVEETKKLTNAAGYFEASIPLSHLLGFAEDYNRIIVNAKHELVLIRSNNDNNAVIKTGEAAEAFTLTIQKIEWLMPYVRLSDTNKIKLLDFIAKDSPIRMSFRSWDLYEYPSIPAAPKHVWVVKTSTQLEKPRFIIFGLQTGRKNEITENASNFDHCNVRDFKVYLNSESYPYGNLNLDFTKNKYAILYEMYCQFQSAYYGKEVEPLLPRDLFLQKCPLFAIDCSKQNDSIKFSPVDIRIEVEAAANFPAETSAYCLIIHDRIIEYNPLSSVVRKL